MKHKSLLSAVFLTCIACFSMFVGIYKIKRTSTRDKNIGLRQQWRRMPDNKECYCIPTERVKMTSSNMSFLCTDGDDLLIPLNELAQHTGPLQKDGLYQQSRGRKRLHAARKCEHQQISRSICSRSLRLYACVGLNTYNSYI